MSWADELRPLRITISTLASECAGTWRGCRADGVSRRRSLAHVGLRVVQRLAYGAGWAAGGLTQSDVEPPASPRTGRVRSFCEKVVHAGSSITVRGVLDDGVLRIAFDAHEVVLPLAVRISETMAVVEEHESRISAGERAVVEVSNECAVAIVITARDTCCELRFRTDGTIRSAACVALVRRREPRYSAVSR